MNIDRVAGESNSPVRLAVVIDSLGQGAGTENQILTILGAFDSSRAVASVHTLRGESSELPCPAVGRWARYAVRSVLSAAGLASLLRLSRALRQDRTDLVATFFIDGNLLGTLGGYLARVPVVSSRRNLGRGYWHTPGHLRRLRWLNSMTHRWLANSEATRQYTAQAEGVPLDRITVIRNAIDVDRFQPATPGERRSARERLGLPADSQILAGVANLRPVKDHRTLLKAFALTPQPPEGLRLILAGKGDEESSLRALAGELGIADRVHFLGSLEDTRPVYHAADAGILASVSESLPNAIMEGLACGLPVAATDVGGVPELLAKQPFGRLAPPSNPEALAAALTDLLAGPARDPGAKEAARTFAVTNFSLPVILEQWYAFLEQVRDETRR